MSRILVEVRYIADDRGEIGRHLVLRQTLEPARPHSDGRSLDNGTLAEGWSLAPSSLRHGLDQHRAGGCCLRML